MWYSAKTLQSGRKFRLAFDLHFIFFTAKNRAKIRQWLDDEKQRKTPINLCKSRIIGAFPTTFLAERSGWGGRIRTYECSSQSAVSYRLTTPQCIRFSKRKRRPYCLTGLRRRLKWGGISDSNRWSPVPQTGALTN